MVDTVDESCWHDQTEGRERTDRPLSAECPRVKVVFFLILLLLLLPLRNYHYGQKCRDRLDTRMNIERSFNFCTGGLRSSWGISRGRRTRHSGRLSDFLAWPHLEKNAVGPWPRWLGAVGRVSLRARYASCRPFRDPMPRASY